MSSILQPTTDLGVGLQLLAFLTLAGWAIWRVRHDRDLRLLLVGATVFGLGLFVLRAMH